MKKVLLLLTHPLVIAAFVTAVILLVFFPSTPKYKLELKEQLTKPADQVEYYEDLDGNGFSDRILFNQYPNKITAATVLMYPSSRLMECTLKGQFVFSHNDNFTAGDFNRDGKKELCVFTVVNDSLFLHIISRFADKNPVCFTRFVQLVGTGAADDQPHLNMVIGGLEDLNLDGYKELIFGVNFGLSALPRNIYSYDIRNDRLTASPKNGYFISSLNLEDLDGDCVREIIVNGYACQNYKDTVAFPVHDQYCWLIVLNRQMQYVFPPRGFPIPGYSILHTLAIATSSGKKGLFSMYAPPVDSGNSLRFYRFDPNGNIIREKEFPEIALHGLYMLVLIYQGTTPLLYFATSDGVQYTIDTSFHLVNTTDYPILAYPFLSADFDEDWDVEHVALDFPKGKMAVFRSDFTEPAFLEVPFTVTSKTKCSLIKNPGMASQLVIDNGSKKFLILYHYNLLYYTKWLIYAGLFLAVYLLILLIARLQRIRFEARIKTEKKITELQLKIVRNQMDPHFTMNAINSVVDAINREEKEEARDNLLHFSQMYRSLVLSAEKIKRTLKEEIDFTENYLALEKFRFGNRFSYDIRINTDVDLSWEVPKMVIQSPVENAVKHGLLNRDAGGEIIIHVRHDGHLLILEITDNGIGRQASAVAEKTSTGKGMAMMDQFFDLYHKITGIRVTSVVTDLTDASGNPAGTKVLVTIPLA